MSGIKVVTAWTTSAVPTSTQKSFMRVDFSDDDTLIGELVDKDEAEMLAIVRAKRVFFIFIRH